jgi:hypothetical protein
MNKPLPDWSEQARSIRIGSEWLHYKGKRYTILAVARHTETLEELIIYQALYESRDIWVRPLKMFLETISYSGVVQARFACL